MKSTIKEKTAGRDSALPKTPSGPTLPGRPVAELRFHGNVENNKEKKVPDQQKNYKKRKAGSGLSDEDSGLQTYMKERINSPSGGIWSVPKGYARWLTVKQIGGDTPISEVSCFKVRSFLESIGVPGVYAVDRKIGSLDIHVKNAGDSARLLQCTTFCGLTVTVEPHTSLNSSKGVVRSEEFRFVDAEEMVSIPGVLKAEPILVHRGGKRVKSGTWILTFDTPVCPGHIDVCWLRVRVSTFVPKPLRCFKCQRFGHKGTKCKSKIDRGIQCGAPEKHENCQKTKKCSNCLGAHSASDKSCKVYKETQQILRHQAENGGTFANSRSVLFPLGTTYSGVVKRQSKVSHNTADSGRSVPDTSGSENATNVSAQTPQPSGGGAGLNHTASNDATEGISLERSSASGSSVDDGTPSDLNEKKVTEKRNSELKLNELMDEGTSQEGPSASIKSGDKNQASNDDAAEETSLEGSSASRSSVDDTTPSVLNEKNVIGKENSELRLHESMDEGISPEGPSASLGSSDKNTEAIENSVGKGGSLMLGFPTDFLQSSTPDVDGSAGGNASAFQKQISKIMERRSQGAKAGLGAPLKKACLSCNLHTKFCWCKDVPYEDPRKKRNKYK